MSLLSHSVEMIRKMDEYCSALTRLGHFNGAVLVGYKGKVVFHKGYGMANFEHDVPNTPETIFRIGSITKQFTAAAIMQLEEQGHLSVDDPISKHLPDYPNGDRITIHHLLTHSSGIPSFTGFTDYRQKMKLPATHEEIIGSFKDLPLLFEPGEKFEYCNSGYVLLSYMIEKIRGRSFASCIDEMFLRPLGMMRTGMDSHKKLLKNRAAGYEVWGDVANAEYMDMSVPSGAGAMYSTVEDLYIWDQALHANRCVSPSSYAKMTNTHMGNYGYGLFIFEEPIWDVPRKIIGHGGGINGFLSEYRRYIEDELTVIVLTNLVTVQPGVLAGQLARIALGEDQALPETHPSIEIKGSLGGFTGYYQVQEDPSVKVAVEEQDGKLFISDNNWFKFELYPFEQTETATSFYTRWAKGIVRIAGDEITAELFGGVHKAFREQR